jgi:hypothetical protein
MAHRVKSRRRHSHKRRSHKHRRQQGGSCAAMPQMNQAFPSHQMGGQNLSVALRGPQRGGMAPIAQGDSYLLDAATRMQAEVGPLDKSFMELPSVIPKQMGGRRKSRRAKSHRGSRKARKSYRKSRKSHRRQRGGMMDFDAAYRYTPQSYAGENSQILTEQTVNPMFKIAGPQA